MAKRMLIDATHPEETRVVVLNGNRLEEFDFESSTKRQVKGNIYLAKITRVEPSLQAAFVDYGGNRHGFLAFSEIHPDYYRIPVGDRPELAADAPTAEAPNEESSDEPGVPIERALPESVFVSAAAFDSEDAPDSEPAAIGSIEDSSAPAPEARLPEDVSTDTGRFDPGPRDATADREPPQHDDQETRPGWAEARQIEIVPAQPPSAILDGAPPQTESQPPSHPQSTATATPASTDRPQARDAGSESPDAGLPTGATLVRFDPEAEPHEAPALAPDPAVAEAAGPIRWVPSAAGEEVVFAGDKDAESEEIVPEAGDELGSSEGGEGGAGDDGDAEIVETLGGDEFDETERQRSRITRQYKIQEVIKRRQIMLVQVTKEERGNKGAALTTYLSLAGRYCVLMPNTARGGGVSRKITNVADRRRLKEILEELDIPEGMGVIVRTAGAERSKAEIKRDYEYLLRLWNEIRELTLRSTAPAVIYEEGDLIKRSIRDLYTRDIDEVLVEGDEGYRTAKAFMKMLMPSHAKRVQPYRDLNIGLLHRFQVESQIDAIHSPIVQLRSGGYVVIDQTEALVAIDVNSGRATRERNIEETALRTNLEAAEEIARQLRLRDLAGLIVIDFIDMEEHRNQAAVERRLKEALKSDRARIQVGRISPFGLLEMSRQRLRSSLAEASTQPCPHCGGTGFIRSTESTALYVLRSIEEEGMRRRSAEVCVYVPTTVALYILNHKRDSLAQLETRYGVRVLVARDDALIPPAFRLERLRDLEPGETAPTPPPLTQSPEGDTDEPDQDIDDLVEAEDGLRIEAEVEDESGRARRRRRRRRRHEDERARPSRSVEEPAGDMEAEQVAAAPEEASDEEDSRLRRRRGRRGGRRRGRRDETAGSALDLGRPAADTIEIVVNAAAEDSPLDFANSHAIATAANEAEEEPQSAGDAALTDAGGIETASLAALAGEAPFSGERPVSAIEPAAAASAEVGEVRVAPADSADSPVVLAGEAEASVPRGPLPFVSGDVEADAASSGEFRGNGAPEAETASPLPLAAAPSEDVEPSPAAGETAPPPAAAEQAEVAGEIVQEVTRKPENPRRGWWQRLIQS